MKSYPSLVGARVLTSLRCLGGTSWQMSSRRLPAGLPLLVAGLPELKLGRERSWRQPVRAVLSGHLLSTPCETSFRKTKVDLSHQEVQTTGISSTVSKWQALYQARHQMDPYINLQGGGH